MARSSLLWIESDEVEGLLADLRRPRAARAALTSAPPAAASSSTEEASPAESESVKTGARSGAATAVPGGVEWPDIEALSRADFDRSGARLIDKLLEDPGVLEAFVADSDGLLLLGDHEDVALPVVAAELTSRWHSLRGQLDIGSDPGLVTVRLDEGRRLEAVGVETGSRHLRILAWVRRV